MLEEIRRCQRIPPKLTGGIKVDRPSRSALGASERIRLRVERTNGRTTPMRRAHTRQGSRTPRGEAHAPRDDDAGGSPSTSRLNRGNLAPSPECREWLGPSREQVRRPGFPRPGEHGAANGPRASGARIASSSVQFLTVCITYTGWSGSPPDFLRSTRVLRPHESGAIDAEWTLRSRAETPPLYRVSGTWGRRISENAVSRFGRFHVGLTEQRRGLRRNHEPDHRARGVRLFRDRQ